MAPSLCQLIAVQEEQIKGLEEQAACYARKLSRFHRSTNQKAYCKARTQYTAVKVALVEERETLEELTSEIVDQEPSARTRKVRFVGEDIDVQPGGLKEDDGLDRMYFDR